MVLTETVSLQTTQLRKMKICILLLSAVAVCLSVPTDSNDIEWKTFKEQYGKHYETPEIESERRKIFFDNKRKIDEHNKLYEEGKRSYQMGVNKFADKTLNEIPKGFLYNSASSFIEPRSLNGPIQFDASGVKLPAQVDWREKNVVSKVKNQYVNACLSCYAFAATDAIESQYAIKLGKHLLLSQQQIVDCSQDEGDLGCGGGMIDWAYKYVMRVGGLEADSDYKYEYADKTCRFNSTKVAATITNYAEIKNGSEIALQEAVAFYGPVSVAIDSNSYEFQYYTEGVYDNPYCTTDVDHAVLVVGYGTEDGKDYWLVKNSYGEEFGAKGFIKMARNKGNQCAIASYANFPIVGEWEPVTAQS